MTDETVISILRNNDRRILQAPAPPTSNFVPALERSLSGFGDSARELAVLYLAKFNPPGSGTLLLRLTIDSSLQTAAAAARSLASGDYSVAGSEIVAAIPSRRDRHVRGYLYLAAGNSKNPPALSAFRDVAKLEKDPDAAESAEVAAVKLGGDAERKSFLKRIQDAPPEKALTIQDQMLYVGDPKLAKALLPWFDNTTGVMRLGSDRQGGRSVRMCDLAAWIAFRLGVKFDLQPQYLENFAPGVLAAAKAACAALPD
jgi:hypothetical protein